ncbi:M23 family metallopeptidase [Paenibacillus sp. SYP-B3998]|uniref:M23 family metallopeptidase n=1 Tax=Paenibacillus sp. SYP-B3998 TaxID=2678564 RepID=A0A6G3ZRX5_9BACL|nr:M23 family metallopeptidase [Paenibacillus sp. SYP-B3998]NEW04788.1 M23 family metallopeptidase [Paenibacillus sp. SYP-B3998]
MKFTKRKMLLASLSLTLCLGGATAASAAWSDTSNNGSSTSQVVSSQSLLSNFYADLNWSWPTDSTTITEGFGNVGSRYHKGVDIGVKLVPVRSAATGVIIQSGTYSDGIVAMTMRHNTKDPATDKYLVTRYLHLKANSQTYSTGDNIGQYVTIATSGNTGNVGYHLHFDVNNVNATYPTDSQTINPMQFYPSISFAKLSNPVDSDEKHDNKYHNSKEYFFDNNVINFVGKDKFNRWFESTNLDNRTLTNFKKEFNLSEKKINELTVEKVKATELRIYGSSAE